MFEGFCFCRSRKTIQERIMKVGRREKNGEAEDKRREETFERDLRVNVKSGSSDRVSNLRLCCGLFLTFN